MIRKVLTYLTILAITALPVQLISASAADISMQMSMSQKMSSTTECMHDELNLESKAVIEKSCCDEQQLSDCQGCNDVPQAASAMFFTASTIVKTPSLASSELFSNNSLLHGVPQKNLIKPPRTII